LLLAELLHLIQLTITEHLQPMEPYLFQELHLLAIILLLQVVVAVDHLVVVVVVVFDLPLQLFQLALSMLLLEVAVIGSATEAIQVSIRLVHQAVVKAVEMETTTQQVAQVVVLEVQADQL
jgi:hypothetical protein